MILAEHRFSLVLVDFAKLGGKSADLANVIELLGLEDRVFKPGDKCGQAPTSFSRTKTGRQNTDCVEKHLCCSNTKNSRGWNSRAGETRRKGWFYLPEWFPSSHGLLKVN